jgi:outer membrane receptor protein involved in Fe transport
MKERRIRAFIALILLATGETFSQETPIIALPPLVINVDPTDSSLPVFSTSVTVLSGEELRGRNALHFQDSLALVPNLTFASATARPRYLQLRGVGERSQFAGEGPPNFSVGTVMDDIDLSGLAGAVSLFDVDSVAVLRGPQATLYGSRGLAGLIRISSTPPSLQQPTLLQWSLGTDELIELGAATGGSLTDNPETLQYRLSLNMLQQDGYRDNVFLNRDDTNKRDEFTGRFQLLYRPGERQSHHLTLILADLDNGYDAFATRGDGFTMFSDEPGEDTLSLYGGSLRSFFSTDASVEVLNILQALTADTRYGYDADWGNDAFWAGAPYFYDPVVEGARYSFTEQLDRVRRQAGGEIRIQNKDGEGLRGDALDWSAGGVLTYLEEEDDYVGFSSLQSDYEAVTYGAYGQLASSLSDPLTMITSLRVENRTSDYRDSEGVTEDTSDWMWGGRAALEAQTTPDQILFLGLSRGFKGGGVNAAPALTPDQRVYDPESLVNLETGIRQNWAQGRGYAAVTLFYMWRRNLQIGTSIQPNPEDPTTFTFFTDNAAKGNNYGAEVELNVPLCERADWFSTLGLLKTEYSDFTDAGGNPNLEGREQPYAPNYNFRTGIRADLTKRWSAQVDVEGQDGFFFSDSFDEKSDPYGLLNASFAYYRGPWSISLWGRNILDKNYDTRGFFFGIEPPDFESKLWTMRGDPAQFGATLRAEL